jgi:hypothetical protein
MSTPKVFPAGTTLDANIGEEWTKETGAVQVQTMEGSTDEVAAQYAAVKTLAIAFNAGNIGSLGYDSKAGRARLVVRFVRENQNIETLYAVDVIRDIREASYFDALTDKQMQDVKKFHELQTYPAVSTPSSWLPLQVTLFEHLYHGAESYIDKQFVLRTSTVVSMATLIEADLTNVGTVVAAPELSSDMKRLIKTLPAGEWLQGPMSAQPLRRGRWRLENELQWAKKWSVVYGGTLFAPVT